MIAAGGFTAYAGAAGAGNACAAGLLIKLLNGTCDVHPSPAGEILLANPPGGGRGQVCVPGNTKGNARRRTSTAL